MPKFTEDRRSEIREALLTAGRRQFVENGLRGTTIVALTEEAGIAAGTFYSFFDSKEDLYATVLRREAETVHADLESVLAAHEDDPATALREFLALAMESIATNPLFRGTIDRDDRERVLEVVDSETIESTRLDKVMLLVPYLSEWQHRGLVRAGDVEAMALGILYVSYLPLHREEVGDRRFDAVRGLLVDWVLESVTDV